MSKCGHLQALPIMTAYDLITFGLTYTLITEPKQLERGSESTQIFPAMANMRMHLGLQNNFETPMS